MSDQVSAQFLRLTASIVLHSQSHNGHSKKEKTANLRTQKKEVKQLYDRKSDQGWMPALI